jgi:hypothetical protein
LYTRQELGIFSVHLFQGFFDRWKDTATQFKELVLDHGEFEIGGMQHEQYNDEIPVLHRQPKFIWLLQ